jgi:hypothetical protein
VEVVVVVVEVGTTNIILTLLERGVGGILEIRLWRQYIVPMFVCRLLTIVVVVVVVGC